MKKKALILSIGLVIITALFILNNNAHKNKGLTSEDAWGKKITKKRLAKKAGAYKLDRPDKYALFQKGIRTPDGKTNTGYSSNYILKELEKAKKRLVPPSTLNNVKTSSIIWTERGPANTPGRTRAIVVLPQDRTNNTWVIGSVSGGIWKTTNGGKSWVEKTKDLPTVAFTTIAVAESNPNVIYAGTGEKGFTNVPAINGNGVFKSIDAGETWVQLTSTADNKIFQNINRLIVDPKNENILLLVNSTSIIDHKTHIIKSTDGGISWSTTLSIIHPKKNGFQQIIATPGNFKVQYVTLFGYGILKSTDAGNSWKKALSPSKNFDGERIEMAISPVNPNRLFASVNGIKTGTNSDLYFSNDAGITWNLLDVSLNLKPADYLTKQGWYNNAILCSPFEENVVYVGGVSILKVEVAKKGESFKKNIATVEQHGTQYFMSLNKFDNATDFNGTLKVSNNNKKINVEIRFGPRISQKAHRFTISAGKSADSDYIYQDYVDVPFEVWDVSNNKQLMVSFRDQQNDGKFNLLKHNIYINESKNSREYLYINNIKYNAFKPNVDIATNGGHIFKVIYNFWPSLKKGATWIPNKLPASTLNIKISEVTLFNTTVDVVSDPYNNFDGTNSFHNFETDVHPDHHAIIALKKNNTTKTFSLLLGTDGGPYISKESTNPGVNQGDWTMVGKTYNTGQFYSADKKPRENVYFGGMQDNGTWKSPLNANASSSYIFQIEGDGFEALWHNQNPDFLIGSAQENAFFRSTDGGISFTAATDGLSGVHPFFSKLAGSKKSPDIIYTVSSSGVFKSINFGKNWQLTPITMQWGRQTNFLDIEISRSNPNIIWAGSGNSSKRRIHVSTNQGKTFLPTSLANFTFGNITRLESHPIEPNTAYMLFSFLGRPKILRTENLGITWKDISGFGGNTVSNNGFPDVGVFCLYVHVDNPKKIWAGTDIGIVESLDNGATWHLLNINMPHVAVWDMKGQDNQIIIATHGRGIWTATVDNSQTDFKEGPMITAFGTSPQKEFLLSILAKESFDSLKIYSNSILIKTIYTIVAGNRIISIPNISFGTKKIQIISYQKGLPFWNSPKYIPQLNILEPSKSFTENMENKNNFFLNGLQISPFFDSNNPTLQSPHNYAINSKLSAILLKPIIVAETNSIFNYKDIAILEPPQNIGDIFNNVAFNDYVVIEATKDGLNWIPIENGYNSSYNAAWLSTFNKKSAIKNSLYVNHAIDLKNKFNKGDTLLFKFKLVSNTQISSWGWALDDLYIQVKPPKAYYSIYPVPSNGKVTIDYQIKNKTQVLLEIMTVKGRIIKSYNLGQKSVGNHRFKFNNYTLKRGVYIFTIKTNNNIRSKRVLIF